jgi:hypothetical protein
MLLGCRDDCLDNVGPSTFHTPTDLLGLLTEIALLFYMQMMYVPHRRHSSPRPVNEDTFTVVYVEMFRIYKTIILPAGLEN